MNKDYRIQIKVKNAPMLRMMESEGFKNAAELYRSCGVNQCQIGRYLSLLDSPLKIDGITWKVSALKIAGTLNCEPDNLFPVQHIEKPLRRNKAEFDASLEEFEQLSGFTKPYLLEENVYREELADITLDSLQCLDSRHQKVIRDRFGLDGEEKTLIKIADELGVTHERVRQMEANAFCKLRRNLMVNKKILTNSFDLESK